MLLLKVRSTSVLTLAALAEGTELLLLFLLAEVPTFDLLLREANVQVEAKSTHRLDSTSLCNLLQRTVDLMQSDVVGTANRASEYSLGSVPVLRKRSTGIPRRQQCMQRCIDMPFRIMLSLSIVLEPASEFWDETRFSSSAFDPFEAFPK